MNQQYVACTVVWRNGGVGTIVAVEPGRACVQDAVTGGYPRWMNDAELAVVDEERLRKAIGEAHESVCNETRAKAFPS